MALESCKTFKNEDKKTHVFGKSNGKGYLELLHFFSLKVRINFPLGICKEEISSKTFEIIMSKARESFFGEWIDEWAKQKMNSTLGTRKYRVVKMVRSQKKKLILDQKKEIKKIDKRARLYRQITQTNRDQSKIGDLVICWAWKN
jgi:hypothetical protein